MLPIGGNWCKLSREVFPDACRMCTMLIVFACGASHTMYVKLYLCKSNTIYLNPFTCNNTEYC